MSGQEKVKTTFKNFVLIQKLSNLDEIIQVKSKSCHVHLIFSKKKFRQKFLLPQYFLYFFDRHLTICKRQTVACITVNITSVKIDDENMSIVNIFPE